MTWIVVAAIGADSARRAQKSEKSMFGFLPFSFFLLQPFCSELRVGGKNEWRGKKEGV